MTTPIRLTRGHRGHPPGAVLHYPDGIAASMVAAGLAIHQGVSAPSEDLPLPLSPSAPADTWEGVPPKAGPGSTKAVWLSYATSVGVECDPSSTRNEIIEAVEAAGFSDVPF